MVLGVLGRTKALTYNDLSIRSAGVDADLSRVSGVSHSPMVVFPIYGFII